jgi:hypothetical protein
LILGSFRQMTEMNGEMGLKTDASLKLRVWKEIKKGS